MKTEFTMEMYKASQTRAAAAQELWKTNPEQARQNAIKSWAPVVAKINKYLDENKKR